MKIAIDATILRKENTGTGFYIINLIKGIQNIHSKDHEFLIYMNRELVGNILDIYDERINIINVNFKVRFFRVLWQLFILPFSLWKRKVDVLHSSNYITPFFKFGFKVIVSIHDMTFFIMPEKYTVIKRIFFRTLVPVFIKVADYVITISENTKKDIVKFFKMNPDRIYVTYPGIPDSYKVSIIKDEQKIKETLIKYNIKRDFILFVGMIEPRKNVLSLLKAFLLVDKIIDMDLVIVGKKGWKYEDIDDFMNKLKSNPIKNNIIFTGYVPENELLYIYQKASIFIYPSFYEGFGLPPLQAMACGIPVITSNTSSLPEVVGDAALIFEPTDIDGIADAIKRIVFDDRLREELKMKGIKRSERFTLKNFAESTISVYEKLRGI
jgi:glycosyltransferase involved in cell wall biosynthesis